MPRMLTEDLIASIKRRTLAPISQQTFQNEDLIALLNEELEIDLIPEIISVRQDFFKQSVVIPILSGLSNYRIPQRAAYGSLCDVFWLDPNNNRFRIPLMTLDRLGTIDLTASGNRPIGYMMQDDTIVLYPPPNVGSNLEVWFYCRPNDLVATTDCAAIVSASTVGATTTFTVDTDLTALLSTGSLIDFVSAQSPFQLWAQSVEVTSVSASQIAVAKSDVSNAVNVVLPQVGDYIAQEMTTNIPMVPQEFHVILAQMVAARLMEGLGDLQKLEAVNAKLMAMKRQALSMIQNRVEDDIKPVVVRGGLADSLIGTRWTR